MLFYKRSKKPMRKMRSLAISGFVMAAFAALVACEGIVSTESRDDAFNVGASPTLEVDSSNGSITFIEGAAGTIRVKATLKKPDDLDYSISQNGDKITVVAEEMDGFSFFGGETPGASIEVTAPPDTKVDLRTSNGRIQAKGLHQSGNLKTSNGRIVLEDAEGDFKLETSNGSIEVTALVGSAKLETSNGNINFSGELEAGSENEMRSSNGSVTVKLDGTPSVELDASTSNGSVTSDLPITIAGRGNDERLSGTIGSGDARLMIRTSNGSVTIR